MGIVNYLLDTHILLWSANDSRKLSDDVKNVIKNTDVQLFVSTVSAYEITNKYRIGRLPGYENVMKNYFDILHKFGVYELPVNMKHAYLAGKFEWFHRDPFDRFLAAQAYIENLVLITNDVVFHSLPWVSVFW